jgi:hypothetical protein
MHIPSMIPTRRPASRPVVPAVAGRLGAGLLLASLVACGGGGGDDPQPRVVRLDLPIEAGFIADAAQAQIQCANRATALAATWTGGWQTTVAGQMSVCELRFSVAEGTPLTVLLQAGPIRNNTDAGARCGAVVAAYLDPSVGLVARWTGGWRTTVSGQMSVCELRFSVEV